MVSRPTHLCAKRESLGGLIHDRHLKQQRLARPVELIALARTIPQVDVIDTKTGDWQAIYFDTNFSVHLGYSLWQVTKHWVALAGRCAALTAKSRDLHRDFFERRLLAFIRTKK